MLGYEESLSMKESMTIGKAAQIVGVHTSTLKRWIKTGKIPRPNADRNGWYIFDAVDIENAKRFAKRVIVSPDKIQTDFLSNKIEGTHGV